MLCTAILLTSRTQVVSFCLLSLQGVDVALISDGSGAGRTGKEQPDVLPPLVPGAKARVQR